MVDNMIMFFFQAAASTDTTRVDLALIAQSNLLTYLDRKGAILSWCSTLASQWELCNKTYELSHVCYVMYILLMQR